VPLPDITDVSIDEADARRVLLVQCMETAPESSLWTAEDRRGQPGACPCSARRACRDRSMVDRGRPVMDRLGSIWHAARGTSSSSFNPFRPLGRFAGSRLRSCAFSTEICIIFA